MAFRDGWVELRFMLEHPRDSLTLNFADPEEKGVHAGHLFRVTARPRGVEIADLKTGVMKLEIRTARKSGKPLPAATQALLKTKTKRFPQAIATSNGIPCRCWCEATPCKSISTAVRPASSVRPAWLIPPNACSGSPCPGKPSSTTSRPTRWRPEPTSTHTSSAAPTPCRGSADWPATAAPARELRHPRPRVGGATDWPATAAPRAQAPPPPTPRRGSADWPATARPARAPPPPTPRRGSADWPATARPAQAPPPPTPRRGSD